MLWTQPSFWLTVLSEEREGHSEPASWGCDLAQVSRASAAMEGKIRTWGGGLRAGLSSPGASKTARRAPSSVLLAEGVERWEGRAWSGSRPRTQQQLCVEGRKESGRQAGALENLSHGPTVG